MRNNRNISKTTSLSPLALELLWLSGIAQVIIRQPPTGLNDPTILHLQKHFTFPNGDMMRSTVTHASYEWRWSWALNICSNSVKRKLRTAIQSSSCSCWQAVGKGATPSNRQRNTWKVGKLFCFLHLITISSWLTRRRMTKTEVKCTSSPTTSTNHHPMRSRARKFVKLNVERWSERRSEAQNAVRCQWFQRTQRASRREMKS